MLGDFFDWHDFLTADSIDLQTLPRRNRKAAKSDVNKRLSKEIKRFCSNNFIGMNEDKLAELYDMIRDHRGLEIPLNDFATQYAEIKSEVLKGIPQHCTVSISLWGLQFRFPEQFLSNDIIQAIKQMRDADERLKPFRMKAHRELRNSKASISQLLQVLDWCSRVCLLSCFNLVESYLNGMAWAFAKDATKFSRLSVRQQKLLQDGQIKEKLLKYPEIIGGIPLWDEHHELVRAFLQNIKPFRDSLVHASPFSAPERFGGRDKLEYLYRIDATKAQEAASVASMILLSLFKHIHGPEASSPEWLCELMKETAPSNPSSA